MDEGVAWRSRQAPSVVRAPSAIVVQQFTASEVGNASVHLATNVRRVPRSFAPRLPW